MVVKATFQEIAKQKKKKEHKKIKELKVTVLIVVSLVIYHTIARSQEILIKVKIQVEKVVINVDNKDIFQEIALKGEIIIEVETAETAETVETTKIRNAIVVDNMDIFQAIVLKEKKNLMLVTLVERVVIEPQNVPKKEDLAQIQEAEEVDTVVEEVEEEIQAHQEVVSVTTVEKVVIIQRNVQENKFSYKWLIQFNKL